MHISGNWAETVSTANKAKPFSNEWKSLYALNGEETLIPRRDGSLGNFQPAMELPHNARAAPTGCPHLDLATNAKQWDDASLQWPDRNAPGPPSADGRNITLPADTVVVVRADALIATSTTPYGRIIIPSGSRLVFHDEGKDGPAIDLHTLGIRVDGVMEAGSPTCRLQGKINITLHGAFGNTRVMMHVVCSYRFQTKKYMLSTRNPPFSVHPPRYTGLGPVPRPRS